MDETAAPGAAQESSDSYLRNVVQELQLLNGILPSAAAAAAQDQDTGTAASQHSYVYESPTPPPTLLQSGHSAPVRFVEPVVDRQVYGRDVGFTVGSALEKGFERMNKQFSCCKYCMRENFILIRILKVFSWFGTFVSSFGFFIRLLRYG